MKKQLETIFRAGGLVCLTGAGISAESGIPAFRGSGGLWETYDPKIYATAAGLTYALRQNPKTLARFMRDFYSILLKAVPNQAHAALALFEKEGVVHSVITQNIDNLHQQAGSRGVIELHGNAFRICCSKCQKTITFEKDRITEMLKFLKVHEDSPFGLMRSLSRYFPHCRCGLRYRPDIVLFGEQLSSQAMTRAHKALDQAQALLVVGTALEVSPASTLPEYAMRKGLPIVEINSETTSLSKDATVKISGKAADVLSELLQVLGYA